MLYKELLEEASSNKKLNERIEENTTSINTIKKKIDKKNVILAQTRRRIENF